MSLGLLRWFFWFFSRVIGLRILQAWKLDFTEIRSEKSDADLPVRWRLKYLLQGYFERFTFSTSSIWTNKNLNWVVKNKIIFGGQENEVDLNIVMKRSRTLIVTSRVDLFCWPKPSEMTSHSSCRQFGMKTYQITLTEHILNYQSIVVCYLDSRHYRKSEVTFRKSWMVLDSAKQDDCKYSTHAYMTRYHGY